MLRVEPFSERHVEEVVALCAGEGWESWTPAKVSSALSAPGVIALVALDSSGTLVGVAELLTDGEVMAYLALLVVSPAARRQGVGVALLKELFQRSGLARMDLLAEAGSTEFYESLAHKTKPGYRLYDIRSR
jgi:ribosomal protein S18 acetylase RimI-like enzyme